MVENIPRRDTTKDDARHDFVLFLQASLITDLLNIFNWKSKRKKMSLKRAIQQEKCKAKIFTQNVLRRLKEEKKLA